MIDFADALTAFAKQPALILERLFFLLDFTPRLLTIQLHLVVHLRFCRKQFCGEIERNSRLRFGLVSGKSLGQQFIEFWKMSAQVADRRGL